MSSRLSFIRFIFTVIGVFLTINCFPLLLLSTNLICLSSMQSFLLAVVVPNEDVLRAWIREAKLPVADSDPLSVLCDLEPVQHAILSAITALGARADRPPWEIPKGVILDHEPFTSVNGLLTPSEKLNRRALRAHYADRLDKLYKTLEKKFEDVRGALLEDIIPNTLGESSLLQEETLINDSLSAVRLMQVLRDRYFWPLSFIPNDTE